jgi:hypothetical protein
MTESNSHLAAPGGLAVQGQEPILPTYYVRHPDDSYSVADPQPRKYAGEITPAMVHEAAKKAWNTDLNYPGNVYKFAGFLNGMLAERGLTWRCPDCSGVGGCVTCRGTGKLPLEPACKTHPGAPHGFNRNASHNADRYVCDCEGWVPEDSGPNATYPGSYVEPLHAHILSLEASQAALISALKEAEAGLEFAGADKLEEKDGFVPHLAADGRTDGQASAPSKKLTRAQSDLLDTAASRPHVTYRDALNVGGSGRTLSSLVAAGLLEHARMVDDSREWRITDAGRAVVTGAAS